MRTIIFLLFVGLCAFGNGAENKKSSEDITQKDTGEKRVKRYYYSSPSYYDGWGRSDGWGSRETGGWAWSWSPPRTGGWSDYERSGWSVPEHNGWSSRSGGWYWTRGGWSWSWSAPATDGWSSGWRY